MWIFNQLLSLYESVHLKIFTIKGEEDSKQWVNEHSREGGSEGLLQLEVGQGPKEARE